MNPIKKVMSASLLVGAASICGVAGAGQVCDRWTQHWPVTNDCRVGGVTYGWSKGENLGGGAKRLSAKLNTPDIGNPIRRLRAAGMNSNGLMMAGCEITIFEEYGWTYTDSDGCDGLPRHRVTGWD